MVLGLAQARSEWFREVSRWATSASLPIEFLKTMSMEEVRVRLRSGRGYSALLIDDSMPGFDRDLVEMAREAGCAVVVVDSGRAHLGSAGLGVSALLPAGFGRDELLAVLGQFATPVARVSSSAEMLTRPQAGVGYRGRLIAVVGPGGTGCSTVAVGLAQALAADPRDAHGVCLADLALHACQAMLHDAGDVMPSVIELVEAHRGGVPTIDAVRSLTWQVDARGYHLLLGLRRHRDWTSIRPRAFEAALDGLRRSFRLVVAEVDADLEGERATGSVDVEDRNPMARTVVDAADLVVVVGGPGISGLHGMLRVVRDLLDHDVPGRSIVPVVNRAPRGPRARAEHTRAFGELLTAARADHGVPSPLHLGGRRQLDGLLRDGEPLPGSWIAPVHDAVRALLERDPDIRLVTSGVADPVPISPGSLGSWTPQDDGDDLAEGAG